MEKSVWGVRTRRCFSAMQRAMFAGATNGGFRLVHYAVMGNHAHILKTPSEVKRARHSLLTNALHHYGHAHADAFASQVADLVSAD